MPGQYLTAAISAGQYTLQNLDWNFGGSATVVAYSNHDANHTYQKWAAFTSAQLSASPIKFLPIAVSGPDPASAIAFTYANAYDQYGISIGPVEGLATAYVRNPDGVTLLIAGGPSALLPDNAAGSPKTLSSGPDRTDISKVGMTMDFVAKPPADFASESGYPGSVGYAQTLVFTWNEDGAITSIPNMELDTSFPYSTADPADNQSFRNSDTPSIGYGSNYLSAVDYFYGFTVYLPPGAASTWIPTTGGKWNWSSYAGYGSPTWYGPVGNPAISDQHIVWPDDAFDWTKTFMVH